MAHDKCSGKILLRCATIKKKWRMAKVTILYSTMYKVQYSPLIACTILYSVSLELKGFVEKRWEDMEMWRLIVSVFKSRKIVIVSGSNQASLTLREKINQNRQDHSVMLSNLYKLETGASPL